MKTTLFVSLHGFLHIMPTLTKQEEKQQRFQNRVDDSRAERRNKTDHDHLCFIVAAEQVGMELTKVKLPSCSEHLSAYQRQFDSPENPKVGMSFGLVLPSKPHWEQN